MNEWKLSCHCTVFRNNKNQMYHTHIHIHIRIFQFCFSSTKCIEMNLKPVDIIKTMPEKCCVTYSPEIKIQITVMIRKISSFYTRISNQILVLLSFKNDWFTSNGISISNIGAHKLLVKKLKLSQSILIRIFWCSTTILKITNLMRARSTSAKIIVYKINRIELPNRKYSIF